MKQRQGSTLMQMQASLRTKVVVTTAVMLTLIIFVYFFAIPNPNMILIAGLVLCSALFGFGGGTVAAAIMFLYTLFFFSTDHSLIHFSPENLQKVFVSLVGIAADMLLVCQVKRREMAAFAEVRSLTEELHRENERLQSISLTDGLTSVRNRAALRADFDSYCGRTLTVLMVDLNDFKTINDTRGHEEGDRILKEAARLLADAFGAEHCYRYGGDEFLVIYPDASEAAFAEKLEALMRAHKAATAGGRTGYSFSVGHVHEVPHDSEDLRELIARADGRMYQAKRDRKRMRPTQAPRTTTPPRTLPQGPSTEFTVTQMEAYLKRMAGTYDLARVVDPIECRILEFDANGTVHRNKKCFGIWNSGQRCLNCSSSLACKTGRPQEKDERLDDQVYHIESDPVTLRLDNGDTYDAVVELVQVGRDGAELVNNRAAENVGNRATQYHAYHDSLTTVLNAEAFYELSRELIDEHPHASWTMVTANIMSFHLVNTLFSVTRGNEVLVRTAGLLQAIAEDEGGLCGRLGGDQFALLVPRTSYREEPLRAMARELTQDFSDGAYTLSIHFGTYHIEDAELPVSVMCGRANAALRTIRESLTETIAYFDDEIRQRLLFEQEVVSGFDAALRDGQIRMYLQPLVCSDGTIIGAEALARWLRPDGSLVMPGDFIEVLERVGLVQHLDMHIWELAVRQLRAWQGTAWEKLTISVNISAKDFYSIDVYDVLTRLVEDFGVDVGKLRLEITETSLLVEPDKGSEIVSRLRERGFVVEIDDFGKGHSSLSLLKNIHADLLKIDMGFLHEIESHERSRVILMSVIDLAGSLDMDVIAEGVESAQQLAMLTDMGCRHFQGFYFSRPVPVAEFERMC